MKLIYDIFELHNMQAILLKFKKEHLLKRGPKFGHFAKSPLTKIRLHQEVGLKGWRTFAHRL